MDMYSEEEGYLVLHNLLVNSTHFLRQVFKLRWEKETRNEWQDYNPQQILEDLDNPMFDQTQSLRILVLNSKPIEEWDMTALSLVLLEFIDESYERENRAVSALQKLRTELASMKSKNISEECYITNLENIQRHLAILGIKRRDVKNAISQVKADSPLQQFGTANESFAQAEKHKKNGKTEEAETIYTQVINTPSLRHLPVNLGIAYEKRSEFYLTLMEEDILTEKKKIIELALNDAKKAMELNDLSYTAKNLAGKCYKWKGNLQQALHHFEQSLALNSFQEGVIADIESCKEQDSLSRSLSDLNLIDKRSLVQKTVEAEVIKKYVETRIYHCKVTVPGETDYLDGLKYFLGLGDKPNNINLAINHFRLAESKNHAEAMFLLAHCYSINLGFKIDCAETLRRLQQVAKMSTTSPGYTTLYKCNWGVATAQGCLGRIYCFQEGQKCFREAVYWLQKGADNGDGNAAHLLARLYSSGEGVVTDIKMAEMYWKESLNLGYAAASAYLLDHYMKELEPEKAEFYKKIRETVKTLEKLPQDEFDEMVSISRETIRDLEVDVRSFEADQSLNTEGLTFGERFYRKVFNQYPNAPVRQRRIWEKTCYLVQATETLGNMVLTERLIDEIQNVNETDFKTASILKKNLKIWNILQQLIAGICESTKSEEEQLAILYLAYTLLKNGFRFVPAQNIEYRKVGKILSSLRWSPLRQNAQVDRKLTLCYEAFLSFTLIDWNAESARTSIQAGIRRYPNIPNYYTLYSIILESLGDYDTARAVLQDGVIIFPDNLELLYLHAVFSSKAALPSDQQNFDESVQKFKNYLHVAPNDDPNVPDAYYGIAELYLRKHESEQQVATTFPFTNLIEMTNYFEKGVKAEKSLLSCYLPYRKSTVRAKVERAVHWSNSSEDVVATEGMERKLETQVYLKSPTRKGLIKLHRQNLHEMRKMMAEKEKCDETTQMADCDTLKQAIKDISLMRPITLEYINPISVHTYENRMLQLTILEDPCMMNAGFLASVAEDGNRDVTRVHVYNFKKEDNITKMFSVGRQITVMNPYHSITSTDQHGCIRIDNLGFVMIHEKKDEMCGFCGNEDSTHSCGKCKRMYCSVECEKLDLQRHGHSLICSTVE